MSSINPIDDLRKIGYESLVQFSLSLPDSNNSAELFQCSKITRCLPGKRISCIGQWQGKTVFAKFFIAPNRAKIHWEKEKTGFQLLNDKNIIAPKILCSGKHQQDDIYFIFYQFLENALDLKPVWENATSHEQLQLLTQLISTVASHHSNGLIQKDLHLNNFVISNDKLYTLDGADIKAIDNHNQHIASENLALLFAQFYPANDCNIETSLQQYFNIRGWPLDLNQIKQIKTTTVKIRENRKKDRLAKTGRCCSLFYYQQTWEQQTICARKYRSAEMDAFLKSPDDFIDFNNLLKKGNTCTVAIVTIDNIQMVLKRYNIKNWQHRLGRAFRASRAKNSWVNAHLLQFYGISTPEPVAMIEKRWGPLRKEAYFLSVLSAGETGDLYFNSDEKTIEQKQTVAQLIMQLLNSFHQLNISHGDLKITNIMVENSQPVIIDLDSMKQHKCPYFFKKAKTKDINRFFKNWQHNPTIAKLFKNTDPLN